MTLLPPIPAVQEKAWLLHAIITILIIIHGICLVSFGTDNEDIPAGVRQSGNAKITFNNAEYVSKVSVCHCAFYLLLIAVLSCCQILHQVIHMEICLL